METIWTKSKWKHDELNHKRVEFSISFKDGILSGISTFLAHPNPQELVSICLLVRKQDSLDSPKYSRRFPLSQREVDHIEKHPVQTVAEFRMLCANVV